MDKTKDTANQLLDYLPKCCDRNEKVELIAAYLSHEYSRGQVDAIAEYGKKLDAMRAEAALKTR